MTVVRKKIVLLSRFFNEPDNLFLTLPVDGNIPKPGIKCLFILIILAFQGASYVNGQQPTLITHYMFTNMAINPAFAGNSGGINVVGLARQHRVEQRRHPLAGAQQGQPRGPPEGHRQRDRAWA